MLAGNRNLVVVVAGRWELAKYAVAVARARPLEAPGVHYGRAARVRIESAVPVPVQVDGRGGV